MKAIPGLILLVILFTACKKGDSGSTQGSNTITGKWNIITVTVIPHDSLGVVMNNGTIYSQPSYVYYQFNNNLTWLENESPGSTPAGEHGNYVLHANTGFTLVNDNLPASPIECKIIALTNSVLDFSHTEPTKFNGVTPGFLEYVFHMTK